MRIIINIYHELDHNFTLKKPRKIADLFITLYQNPGHAMGDCFDNNSQ